MVNIPIIHEAVTAVQSLGDAITGDTKGARQRWEDYSEQSVIGSGVKAAACAVQGDMEGANRCGKGMGRATGSALLGGGMLRNVPVLQELATCGDSLGDMIGGGNDEMARQRWKDYSEGSVIGSGARSAVAAYHGDIDEAQRLGKACGASALSGAVTAAAVAATVATGGAAAPAGAAMATAAGGAVGATTGVVGTLAENAIRGDDSKSGDLVASGIMGAASGAVAGRVAASKANQTRVYRVMRKDAGDVAVKSGKLQRANNQVYSNSETWVSESSKHSKTYVSKPLGANEAPGVVKKAYQVTMDKRHYQDIKSGSIPQRGSRAINRGNPNPHNVLNAERLSAHPTGKVNMGVKTANLDHFNEGVIKIKEINPNSMMQSGKIKPVKRYGKAATIAAMVAEENRRISGRDDNSTLW